ncbi:Mrp/NBP35 family ATP-binding protein [Cellulomonas composti]|uniref:Iron-sulfur cluster carrier protein n=1 Tax=Cellulomonas composti TaxID=266130 RepID=A0A511J9B0_9CELL|nr:P-loop NTPase [Cellulomonas composti]GEL94574.1 iron-sulfur cluster carrier protein [Cellulomonas composti]
MPDEQDAPTPTPHPAPDDASTPDALAAAVRAALATVLDPEIRRPITELGMVRSVDVADTPAGARATVGLDLTTPGCPLKETLTRDVTAAALTVPGVAAADVVMGVMSAEQRADLRRLLRGTDAEPQIPFAQATSLTKVFAIASGKGGVGKSSVTANLAVALAEDGLRVGVVDADIYGFSIPRMLGVTRPPTKVDDMLLPPIAHGVKVVSIGMFVPAGQPVVWRGPMLHRALQQFLADVFWGDLDVLLLDLPPGTGDIAISVAQLLPGSQIVVVTTPQDAAAEVAERAGSVAVQTRQQVVGVVENMSWLDQPDGSRLEIFGSGGGRRVADRLSQLTGGDVPLLGQIPLDTRLREAGDAGTPVVLSDPDSPAAEALRDIARGLGTRRRGLAGMSLGLRPAGR